MKNLVFSLNYYITNLNLCVYKNNHCNQICNVMKGDKLICCYENFIIFPFVCYFVTQVHHHLKRG